MTLSEIFWIFHVLSQNRGVDCNGDDIRRVAGTVGTVSPLFKIKETLWGALSSENETMKTSIKDRNDLYCNLVASQDALMEVYVDDPPDVPDLEETHQDDLLMRMQCKNRQRHKVADCNLVFVRDGFNDVHGCS